MTNRELLELAAKAAGIELIEINDMDNGRCYPICRVDRSITSSGVRLWNPLTSDGDALRLAVRLGLIVLIAEDVAQAGLLHSFDEPISEPLGSDPYAATRRAIVRTAAEIGRNMI